MSLLQIAGFCLILVSALMTLTWWVARRIDNYSIVDAVWALSFALLAPIVVLLSPGYMPRRLLLASLFVVWGFRLGSYLAKRIFSHLEVEDSRYIQLRKDYGENVGARFFLFFQYQAISVVLLLAPLFIAGQNREEGLHPFEIFGAFIWFIGIVGESIADWQMSRFRNNPANRGQVCQDGLWFYSRHPNYFFEAVLWLGYGVFALASPQGWIAFYAPALIWFLLLKVTGIPYAEAQSLKSRGDRYREYQRTTSAFFPLPKKRT